MKKYCLEIIVFVTGAVVMVMELVGSRVIAPYSGTSLAVWTSLIGIILGSLSVGYFLGGRLADQRLSYKTLGNIILFSALLTGLINFIKPLAFLLVQGNLDIRFGSILLTTVLFAPVSVVLGMVPTYSVRLRIKDVKTSGATIGRLYALSTIGSIVGTFAAGFFLISFFGSSKILVLLSVTLFITSLLAFWGNWEKKMLVTMIIIVAGNLLSGGLNEFYKDVIVEDKDSSYNRIIVAKFTHYQNKRPVLALITGRIFGPTTFQTSVYLDGKKEPVPGYLDYFDLAKVFNPHTNFALMIGGGGYSYPQEFLDKNPNARLDVVEIDPKLTEVAKKYFGLEDNTRLVIHHTDGRNYINKVDKKYDVIFLDVFSGDSSIPFHLTTIETIRRLYEILNPQGAIYMNTISSLEGDTGKYFRAQLSTYKRVFPYVLVFPVDDANDTKLIQNIVIVALKNKTGLTTQENLIQEYSSYLSHLYAKDLEEGLVLSDDYAPVEQYFMPIVNAWAKKT